MSDRDPSGAVSPCVGVCRLDAAARCAGCGRTVDEIARWAAMDERQRRGVLARLRDGVPPPAR